MTIIIYSYLKYTYVNYDFQGAIKSKSRQLSIAVSVSKSKSRYDAKLLKNKTRHLYSKRDV